MTTDQGQPERARWGAETRRAIANFPISGDPVPHEVVRALARIKSAAAEVNARHGVVPAEVGRAIGIAADEVAAGAWADQFPVDVFQTGSGTSTNMNVNEVIADRAGELLGAPVHPNDHVNASQSSNDAFPSAVRLAAAALVERSFIPSLDRLAISLRELSATHRSTVKMGRTHLMDAVPMTFGQEAGAWARAVELGSDRLRAGLVRVVALPLGGTAVGTGLNAPDGFGAEVAAELQRRERFETTLRESDDHVEAQSAHDALVELSGATKVVALSLYKISGDLRLLASGPTGGLAEIRLPELQAGSSIMPGKVNPVVPEAVQQVTAQVVGNDATITFAATLSTLQLNTAAPVIARALVSSLRLLASASSVLRERCVAGVEVDAERMARLARGSSAVVTALTPLVGYDAAAALAKHARDDGRSIDDLLDDLAEQHHVSVGELRAAVDVRSMARPLVASPASDLPPVSPA